MMADCTLHSPSSVTCKSLFWVFFKQSMQEVPGGRTEGVGKTHLLCEGDGINILSLLVGATEGTVSEQVKGEAH